MAESVHVFNARNLANKLGLDEWGLKLIQEAAWNVYDEVSADLTPDFKSRNTCRRSTVMCVVTDASRLQRELRRKLAIFSVEYESDPRLMKIVEASYSDKINILIRPTFEASEYEVFGERNGYDE